LQRAALNAHRQRVQRPRRRPSQNLAVQTKDAGVTRAGKLVLGSLPAIRTAQVRTAAVIDHELTAALSHDPDALDIRGLNPTVSSTHGDVDCFWDPLLEAVGAA